MYDPYQQQRAQLQQYGLPIPQPYNQPQYTPPPQYGGGGQPQYNYPPPQQTTPNPVPPQVNNQQHAQLAEEKQKLDTYRKQLADVHQELKRKSDLVEGLKTLGINTIQDFQEYNKTAAAQQEPAQEPEEAPWEPPQDDLLVSDAEKKLTDKIAQIEKQNFRLQHLIERKDFREQIKESIKGNEDYQFLAKKLDDDRVIDNIMYTRHQYQQQYKQELPLEDALKFAEKSLRDVFKSLGGQIEKPIDPFTKPQVKRGMAAQVEQESPLEKPQRPSAFPPTPQHLTQSPYNKPQPQFPQLQQQQQQQPQPQNQTLPPYGQDSVPKDKIPDIDGSQGFHRDQALTQFLHEKGYA